jgi:hypothetical protein
MDPVSMLERQNLYGTANEESQAAGGQRGWASLGEALAPGAGEMMGEQAELHGELMGAQTISALAQARQRVVDNQSRDTAAQALQSPQLQQVLGIGPEIGNYAATAARAGAKPEDITNFVQGVQKAKNLQTLSNPNADPQARQAAAVAEGRTPQHAVGTAGSYMDELSYNPGNPGTGPVHVSPQQSEMNESLVTERGAQAARAAAGQQNNGDKLRTGMQWSLDQDGNPVMGDDGHYQQVPNPAAGEGAVIHRAHENSVVSAQELAAEMHNVNKMGYNTTAGYTNFGDAKAGVLHTLAGNLGRSLSTEDQQQYKTTITNAGRFISTLEINGQIPRGQLTSQLDNAIQNNPGSTEGARLYNVAIIRQIMDRADKAYQSNNAPPNLKRAVHAASSEIAQSVPFTPDDVIDFERAKGFNGSFQDYLKANPSQGFPDTGGIVPTHTPTRGAAPAATAPAPAAQPMALGDYLKKQGY